MKIINLFFASGTIGLIGAIVYQIANDYWMFHPKRKTRTIAYAVCQSCKLIAFLFFPYMIILGLIIALLFLGG